MNPLTGLLAQERIKDMHRTASKTRHVPRRRSRRQKTPA